MLKQDEEPTSSEGDESQEEDEEGEEGDEEDVVEEESGVPPSGMFPKVDIDAGLYSALKDQFMRFDYDCSGAIDSEAELTMMATNVAYMAYSEFHVKVGVHEVDRFCEDLMPLVMADGVGAEDFINSVVPAFGFFLRDGTKVPVQPREIDETKKPSEVLASIGFDEWLVEKYGMDMCNYYVDGGTVEDEAEVKAAAKDEYFAMTNRVKMQWKLHENSMGWRAAHRMNQDTSKFEQNHELFVQQLGDLDDVEDIARKDRVRIGHSSCWIPGFSCLKEQEKLFKALLSVRTNPFFQWFMLSVNLINVFTLMTQKPVLNCDQDDISDTYDSYQTKTLPTLDLITNVIFSLDMILAMCVLGLRQYFADSFNQLDFVVVFTGWGDTAGVGGNFSAFRALRVLRPLRLIKFFTGIQAIIGSIYHNLALIINVLSFMGFFMLVFGILAIQNFGGVYSQRCIVQSAVPTLTTERDYNPLSYSAIGESAKYGEFDTFCANTTRFAPLGTCPSYQECLAGNTNPHHGSASFDDFFAAFFVMFQVQTLSTWYEYDYFNMQSIGTLATMYNQGLIFLVGFIVSQLFVAVVCFGFENLEAQLNTPIFSDTVLGKPQLMSTDDPDDNLCGCCEDEYHPLSAAPLEEPPDRGVQDGIRVKISYLHHRSAPHPLNKDGDFCTSGEFEANPICSVNAIGVEPNIKRDSGLSERAPRVEGVNEDEYTKYRRVMAQMQQERQDEKDLAAAVPLRPESEEPDIQPICFNYTDLKSWSNETIWSTDIMLRAQEEVEDEVQIQYFLDDDGDIGAELPIVSIIRDHVEVPDNTDEVPELILHMRAKLRVEAPLLSDASHLCEKHFDGTERMKDIKAAVLADYQEAGLLQDKTVADMHLMIDEDFVEDEATLWKMSKTYVELFDPLHSVVELTVLMDKNEYFIMTPLFDTTIIVSILLNTLFLMFEHYDKSVKEKPYMSDAWDATLIAAGWIFNIIFILEMLIKFYCMKGFPNYWRVGPNRFDFIIVMSSIINIFLDMFEIDIAILKVLRVFRALRVVRVLRRIPSVQLIIDAAMCSITSILNIFTFMMVVLVVYACLGMQFYGNQFSKLSDPGMPCNGLPRANFDNFYTAFFALFQVLTGSAWELVLFDCINACAMGGVVGAIFILSFFIVSNYVILNLFIGAILANMSSVEDEDRFKLTEGMKNDKNDRQRRSREAQLFVNQQEKEWEKRGRSGNLCTLSQVMELGCARKTFEESTVAIWAPIEDGDEDEKVWIGDDIKRCGSPLTNKTCFCLGPDNCFRQCMVTLVENPVFDFFILLVIIYSTVLLALDNPTTRDSDAWVDFFNLNDYLFITIFTIEFSMKIVSHGFAHTDNIELMLSSPEKVKALCLGDIGRASYLYDAWNYLDIVVLVVSYVGLTGATEGPLKLLRLIRAFRPLRMVNRIKGMKLVLEALADAVVPLTNVCVLISAAFLIFAILGVSLFKGRYWSCNGCYGEYCDTFRDQDHCFGTYDLGGYQGPSIWNNPAIFSNPLTYGTFSFDNVYSAYMALFEVSTGDSWETMLWATTNIPAKPREPPGCDINWGWGFYMVIFVFVGQLFMIQLFVAVIIDTFVVREGSGLFTGDQLMLSDVMKLNKQLIPEPKPPCPSEDGEYKADNIRSTAYLMFTDVRPLPMPGLEKYLEDERIPNLAEVETIPRLRRNIEQTLKQRSVTEEADILKKMDEALEVMGADLERKEEDARVFNEFTEEYLAAQGVPDGWVYQCGVYFDNCITVCIIINIFFMCTYHHNQSSTWTAAQDAQNIIFTVIFTFEMIVKHLGLGFHTYWTDPLNAFDGVVVTVSILFIPLEGGALAGLFRVCRIFRLIKRAPQIKALMTTLVVTLPAISNVFMVLFLVFFIFAVIGVELFGKMRLGQSISIMANFSTWMDALHVLWRNALGNWRSTMYETFVSFPDCTNLVKDAQPGLDKAFTDCGDPIKGTIFFLSFMVVSAFAVLNLVIAIILNAFTWCYSLEPSEITGALFISAAHLRHFKSIWDRFDIDGDASMPVSDLQCLLSIAQKNIPNLFLTGEVNQKDEPLYSDYSSFGTGPGGADANDDERICRDKFKSLCKKLSQIEESREIFFRVENNGEDVWNGDNSDVFEEDFERWNQNHSTQLLDKKGGVCELVGVEYLSLIYILVQEPLGLCDHDLYVHNQYQDPYGPILPGYLPDSIKDDGLTLVELPEPKVETPKSKNKQDVFAPAVYNAEPKEAEEEDEVEEPEDIPEGLEQFGHEYGMEMEPVINSPDEPSESSDRSPGSQTNLLPPKISPFVSPEPTPREEEEPEDPLMVAWREEHLETLETYFVRYDLDKSGTLNDPDELQYLTINVIKATGIKCSLSTIDEVLEPGMEAMRIGELWTFKEFVTWFHTKFVVATAIAAPSPSTQPQTNQAFASAPIKKKKKKKDKSPAV